MLDLNKHIVTDGSQPFHSNGIARVANGDRIGSASNMSFEKRQQIEKNRQNIAGYNRSVIGSNYGALRARPVSNANITRNSMIRQNMANTPNAMPQRYNPYA